MVIGVLFIKKELVFVSAYKDKGTKSVPRLSSVWAIIF
jgi:hypothetical protein